MDLIRTLKRAWIQYREFEKVRLELGDASDRQLADMGIARGDVGRIAYEHAEEQARRMVPEPARAAGRSARGARGGLRFARLGEPR